MLLFPKEPLKNLSKITLLAKYPFGHINVFCMHGDMEHVLRIGQQV